MHATHVHPRASPPDASLGHAHDGGRSSALERSTARMHSAEHALLALPPVNDPRPRRTFPAARTRQLRPSHSSGGVGSLPLFAGSRSATLMRPPTFSLAVHPARLRQSHTRDLGRVRTPVSYWIALSRVWRASADRTRTTTRDSVTSSSAQHDEPSWLPELRAPAIPAVLPSAVQQHR